ncbi:hypothetical protein KKC88_01360 [Patescibacteria group bacterium]|nr:hypothetical protein [Patescibacteria group bacterium]MBU1673475.1 hypothetical protein [Patescibacteria group bacterium]MBU1963994.1 hypothetical protein [Patescibacteria group bacterium]
MPNNDFSTKREADAAIAEIVDFLVEKDLTENQKIALEGVIARKPLAEVGKDMTLTSGEKGVKPLWVKRFFNEATGILENHLHEMVGLHKKDLYDSLKKIRLQKKLKKFFEELPEIMQSGSYTDEKYPDVYSLLDDAIKGGHLPVKARQAVVELLQGVPPDKIPEKLVSGEEAIAQLASALYDEYGIKNDPRLEALADITAVPDFEPTYGQIKFASRLSKNMYEKDHALTEGEWDKANFEDAVRQESETSDPEDVVAKKEELTDLAEIVDYYLNYVFDDRKKNIFLARLRGETLEEIAQKTPSLKAIEAYKRDQLFGTADKRTLEDNTVTREQIKQINDKSIREIKKIFRRYQNESGKFPKTGVMAEIRRNKEEKIAGSPEKKMEKFQPTPDLLAATIEILLEQKMDMEKEEARKDRENRNQQAHKLINETFNRWR